MALQGGTVRWVIEADDSGFNEAVDSAQAKAKQLKTTFEQSAPSKSGLFGNLTNSVLGVKDSLLGLGKSLTSIGWGTFSAGATAVTGALTTLIAKGISGTDFLETARVSMAGLTGSIESGNQALSSAAKFWQNNPFDRFTTTNATKQLIQFGRSLNQIDGDLELLGDISLSTGINMDELARYFARTAASGRAMTMDIEMMSDRGIPIYQKLSEVTGKTTSAIRDMASKGQISFEIFEQAMRKSVNPEAMEEFNNTLARQKDRLSGSISNLSGDLAGYKIVNDQLVISANGLEKAWTRLLKTLATELRGEKLRSSMEKLGKSFAQIVDRIEPFIPLLVDKLGSALEFVANHSSSLIPILGGVLAVFGKFGQNIPGIGGIIGAVGNSFNGLTKSIVGLVSKNPLLAGFIAIFGTGLVSAIKNSGSFRQSISELLGALGNLFQTLLPAAQTFIKIFVQIASSKAVVGVLQTIVKVLTVLANVISIIPIDMLAGLVTSLLMFKLISVSPMTALAGGIMLVVGALSSFIEEAGGLQSVANWIGQGLANIGNSFKSFIGIIGQITSNIFQAIAKPFTKVLVFLKSIPSNLITIGHNMMTGLLNGIIKGAKKVTQFIRDLANSILSTFKAVLGIHSPSTVMEAQGRFIALGLANGINKNSSLVDKAMDALASSAIDSANRIIGNKVDFGLLDYNGEYKAWKKISKLFVQGSEQYQTAMEKMEDVRKNVNLQIVKLQNEYNDTLDDTIDKISNMYGLFDKVDLSGGMNIGEITSNLDQQVARLQEWSAAQEAISNLELDPKFIEELQAMGVDATNELAAIAGASAGQISQLNNLWLKKQEIASKAATRQLSGLKKDTLDEISQLKDGIDGETVDVVEIGGRLVSSIGDGITGALPTLESSFAQLNDFIAKQLTEASENVAGNSEDIFNNSDVKKGIEKSIEDLFQGIEGSVQNMGKGLAGIIAAVIGAPVIWKVLGKLNLQEKIGKFLSFGKASKIADSKETIAQISQVGQGLNQTAESLSQAGTQMTKAQSAMKTMRSAILNVILIAGAIASLGVALRIAYEAIPDNIVGLGVKLGVMAGAVTAFGGLAVAADKLDITFKDNILPLIEIAGTIVLLGLALASINVLVPDDLGPLTDKLAVMALAVGAFAFLGTKIGKVPVKQLATGLIAILGVAGDIGALALAMGEIDSKITSDFNVLVGKIGAMGAAVTEIGVLAGVFGGIASTGIGGVVIAAGIAAILGIAGDIAAVANVIGEVDRQIPSGYGRIKEKMALLVDVVKFITSAQIAGFFSNISTAIKLAPVKDIADAYVNIAYQLNRLQSISLTPDAIFRNVMLIKTTIGIISDSGENSIGGAIVEIIGACSEKFKTLQTTEITDAYIRIAEDLSRLQEIELNNEAIAEKINIVGSVVQTVTQPATESGFFSQIIDASKVAKESEIVKSAADILDIYSGLGDTLSKISNIKADSSKVKERLTELGDIVQLISETKGSKGIFGKIGDFFTGGGIDEEQTKKVASIISALANVGKQANKIPSVDYSAIEPRVGDLQKIITRLGDVKAVDGISEKPALVDSATQIVKKLVDFSKALTSLESGEDKTAIIDGLISALNTIVTNVVDSISERLEDVKTVGVNLAVKLIEGINSKNDGASKAGADLQGSLWHAIEGKLQDEFWQGAALAGRVVEGLNSKIGEFESVGRNAVQGFINGANSQDPYAAGTQIADRFLQGLKDRGQQGSPWKTTFQSGTWAVEGLIDGLAKGEHALIQEATTLGDEVIDALDMSNITLSPTLDARVNTMAKEIPTMSFDDEYGSYYSQSKRPVTINQTNNNYTQYSLEQVNRDLAWELSKV